MKMPPTSTIIITGGTGSLGSSLARTLATSYPGDFHLVLTCRNTTDSRALSISEFLTSKNSSFSIDKLDLSDLEDVKTFAERVKSKTAAGEIPGLVGGGVVNSAAYMTFLKDSKTKDGLDAMYTINCLAPALLLRCLLPVLVGKAGSEGGVATVVNVGTAAHEVGQVDYFEKQKEGNKNAKEGERLGFPEGMKRYGSSKLLTVMTAYAFQRQLHSVSSASVSHLTATKLSLEPFSCPFHIYSVQVR
jgi:NAD(P)-dependent dehydrogenase (short-subunit alcohol dehydrogenase family)